MLQGETPNREVSMTLPCAKTCKTLWRSSVDHHSFSSNRSTRSPKHNSSTIQSYTKLITQHLGLSNSKTERSAPVHIFSPILVINTELLQMFSLSPLTLQWSSVSASGGRDGVEPSPAEIHFIRVSRDQESALQIAAVHPKLVRPAAIKQAGILSFPPQKKLYIFDFVCQ